MTELQRAFLALQGKSFPRAGDRGVFKPRVGLPCCAEIEVLRVSATGHTIWTRFVTERAQREFSFSHQRTHQWRRVHGPTALYSAGNRSSLAPSGWITFPAMMPKDTV